MFPKHQKPKQMLFFHGAGRDDNGANGCGKQPSPANLVATVDISGKMRFYQSVKKCIRDV